MLEPSTTFKADLRPISWAVIALVAALLVLPGRARADEEAVTVSPESTVGDITAEPGNIPLLSLPDPLGEASYRPGRGLHIGETGFALGGYSSVNLVRDEGQAAKLSLEDLSLFLIYNPTSRLHLFSELEFEDLVHVDGDGHGGTQGATFTAERLYGDFSVSDALNVRIGKFLTPVGRWNVIHAQPLTWTTSRPLATLLPFDPHATGVALYGSAFPGLNAVNYTIYGQTVSQLDPTPDEAQPADRSVGGRLEYWRGTSFSLGSSSYAFSRFGVWQVLGGLDLLWEVGRLQVMGEFVYEGAARSRPLQWGLYLQGVYELVPRLFLVGRYEHYRQPSPEPEVNLYDPGIAWRPLPFLVLKAEYLIEDHPSTESPPGFKSSVAILF